MTDKDFRSLMRGLDEAHRYTAGEDVGITHYFHLGVDAEDYQSPTYSLSYSNFDYNEGLPDDELIAPERGYTPLPEERPADYGPIEFDIADLDDE